MFWNPFAHLIGSKTHPFSRIIHASFSKRIKDTFQLFFGSEGHYGYGSEHQRGEKLGLIDYIFPFPLLFEKAWDNSSNLFFTALLAIPYVVLQVIKVIAAAALTLLLSPFILAVHFFTKFKSNEYEERVMKLKVLIPNGKEVFKEGTIDDVLRAIPELTVDRLGRDLDESGHEKSSGQTYLYLAQSLGSGYGVVGGYVAKVPMIPENYEGLSALCKGNFFKVEECVPESIARLTVDEEVSKLKPKSAVKLS